MVVIALVFAQNASGQTCRKLAEILYKNANNLRGNMRGVFVAATFAVLASVAAIVGKDVSAVDSDGIHRCPLILFCEFTRRLFPEKHYCAYASDLEGTEMFCMPPVFDMPNTPPAPGPLFTDQASCRTYAESVYGATADMEFMYVTSPQLDAMYGEAHCRHHPMYAVLQDSTLLADMLTGNTPIPRLSSPAPASVPWMSLVLGIASSSLLLAAA